MGLCLLPTSQLLDLNGSGSEAKGTAAVIEAKPNSIDS